MKYIKTFEEFTSKIIPKNRLDTLNQSIMSYTNSINIQMNNKNPNIATMKLLGIQVNKYSKIIWKFIDEFGKQACMNQINKELKPSLEKLIGNK